MYKRRELRFKHCYQCHVGFLKNVQTINDIIFSYWLQINLIIISNILLLFVQLSYISPCLSLCLHMIFRQCAASIYRNVSGCVRIRQKSTNLLPRCLDFLETIVAKLQHYMCVSVFERCFSSKMRHMHTCMHALCIFHTQFVW